MKVATALRKGRKATSELASLAVQEAMRKAELDVARAVLLFLTSNFARDPEPTVLAAARTANCMQVAGCTALGVFTEEDWILDAPAAAVMVLGGNDCTIPAVDENDPWRLTLAAPSAIETAWLREPARRFGGISGDATGKGPYKVWGGSRVAPEGRIELPFHGDSLQIGVSRGIAALCAPAPARMHSHEVETVEGMPSLVHLARHLPKELADDAVFPLHLLMAGIVWGDPDTAIAESRYHLLPLLGIDMEARRVSLSNEMEGDMRLFWALRQPDAAERDMTDMLDRMACQQPEFALCFACIGRGPAFYGGKDRDIASIVRRFPAMPLLGFYGNGEICHEGGQNHLLQYSTVIALQERHVYSHA